MFFLLYKLIALLVVIVISGVIAVPMNSRPDRSLQARTPSAYIKFPAKRMAKPSPIPLSLSQPIALRGSSLAARHVASAKESWSASPPGSIVAPPHQISLMLVDEVAQTAKDETPAKRGALFQHWRLMQRQQRPSTLRQALK